MNFIKKTPISMIIIHFWNNGVFMKTLFLGLMYSICEDFIFGIHVIGMTNEWTDVRTIIKVLPNFIQ